MYCQWFRYETQMRPPVGAVEPTEEEFKHEVSRLSRNQYRPHVFRNCIYATNSAGDLHILWKFPPRGRR